MSELSAGHPTEAGGIGNARRAVSAFLQSSEAVTDRSGCRPRTADLAPAAGRAARHSRAPVHRHRQCTGPEMKREVTMPHDYWFPR